MGLSPSTLAFAVADGAGSASHSEAGARYAVDRFLKEALAERRETEQEADCSKRIFNAIRQGLIEEAEKAGVQPQEFSCTLLAGYLSPSLSWVAQVGDGAIIVSEAPQTYRPATWPSSGEYANVTTFLTSLDWETHFQFYLLSAPPQALAAFTDGLQDLILVNSTRSVHGGFFDPLFAKLLEVPEARILEEPLAAFLASQLIVERTDDDKTLVLISRREPSPEPPNEVRPAD